MKPCRGLHQAKGHDVDGLSEDPPPHHAADCRYCQGARRRQRSQQPWTQEEKDDHLGRNRLRPQHAAGGGADPCLHPTDHCKGIVHRMAAENEGGDDDDPHESALAEERQPGPMRNLFTLARRIGRKCRHQAGDDGDRQQTRRAQPEGRRKAVAARRLSRHERSRDKCGRAHAAHPAILKGLLVRPWASVGERQGCRTAERAARAPRPAAG